MELKIISFNIRCCDDPNGNSVKERAPRLEKITGKYDADLIAFQEFTPLWEPFINEYYGKDYEIFNKYRAESNLESAPILWKKDKFNCIKKGYFWLSDTPEVESRGWDELYNCYRICEYAVLEHKLAGKEITFMNTHFGFGDKGQSDSARLIYEYSKKISDNPTFITGDFNMKPQSKGYAVMSKYFTDVNAATVNDLRTTYHGYHPENTDEHIDYCFVNEKIIPISQTIIDDMVDGGFPSDHYGLLIKLNV
ncbi:MAG: endonuclease/exonuclease/phosphatase family protein [Clostridia bacterium]|nr:endonuclease/exonuclease/phosphatase family protein [Clostridia bacterium]